uniref:Uncharacterized protein n=1 Tax=Glossina palpalis gambiensis TaxID=67801 RepID=A0A1B0C5R7_9MUSC
MFGGNIENKKKATTKTITTRICLEHNDDRNSNGDGYNSRLFYLRVNLIDLNYMLNYCFALSDLLPMRFDAIVYWQQEIYIKMTMININSIWHFVLSTFSTFLVIITRL